MVGARTRSARYRHCPTPPEEDILILTCYEVLVEAQGGAAGVGSIDR